jgi:hypothetical protein
MESITLEQSAVTAIPTPLPENTHVDGMPRNSAALRRLMEEVRLEETNGSSIAGSYDRAHNRHNR